jgi:hypothetical protein
MQGAVIPAEAVEELAKLPPPEVLRGQLLGAIVAPLTTVVGLLAAPLRDLVGLIDARIEQLGDSGGAESPDEQVEASNVEDSAPAESSEEE